MNLCTEGLPSFEEIRSCWGPEVLLRLGRECSGWQGSLHMSWQQGASSCLLSIHSEFGSVVL